ncbi:MAG: hypothetical protein ACRCYX_14165 [Dermatophilaceae bacterium]
MWGLGPTSDSCVDSDVPVVAGGAVPVVPGGGVPVVIGASVWGDTSGDVPVVAGLGVLVDAGVSAVRGVDVPVVVGD